MPSLSIIGIDVLTDGIKVTFDKGAKIYLEFIPGAKHKKHDTTVVMFPHQYDIDEVLDQIINRSVRKVELTDIRTNDAIVTYGGYYRYLHKPHRVRWVTRTYKLNEIKTRIEAGRGGRTKFSPYGVSHSDNRPSGSAIV